MSSAAGENGRHDELGSDGLREVSREVVRFYREQFGREPASARTDFAGPDVLICTLEGSLTRAEQTMVAMREDQRVRDIRLCFQHTREAEFCSAVERVTGRTVLGFVSGLDANQDLASEIFYLEPRTPP